MEPEAAQGLARVGEPPAAALKVLVWVRIQRRKEVQSWEKRVKMRVKACRETRLFMERGGDEKR